ncbi:MAG: sigma-70 family RNA polymerase sigma factor [Fulvivirga sp.]
MKKQSAFLKVLEEHKGIIFKVCNMYCSDHEEQKDLVQEVIIQLWKSFDKYDSSYKLSTWIYRIALNVAISNYRKLNTRSKYILPMQASFLDVSDEAEDNVPDDIALLRQFIKGFDEFNKALMILYLDGNSHEEISKILNISTSNVSTKINRLKKKLKEQFKTATS